MDHGNPVRDLKSEDFEVFEDGHKQRISNFSFIDTLSSPAQPHPAAVRPLDKSPLYIPPPELRPEQVKRTIAVVVDDLSMSPTSIIETKQALKKFVSDRMEPSDLVAVIRTLTPAAMRSASRRKRSCIWRPKRAVSQCITPTTLCGDWTG